MAEVHILTSSRARLGSSHQREESVLALYPLPEGTIDRTENWDDHTINTFVLDRDGVTASFVISRAALPQGQTMKEYSASELHRMSHALPGYALTHRGRIQIADQVTELIELGWSSKQGRVDQLLAYLPVNGRLVVLTGSSPAPIAPALRQQILEMIMSFEPAGKAGSVRA